MLGCQKENLEIQPQEKLPIETVGDKEALEFLNNLNLYKTSQKEVQFVALQLDKMTREKLINSDQMLTVIPATTIYKDHYSRVLLLKLDGELRSVVFSMYAADGRQGENFSGEILITGLNGEFINGYRARNGTLISKFIKKKWDAKSHGSLKSTGDFCPDHGMCEVGSLCNFCLQTLDEVELTGGGSTDSGISLGGIYPDYKTESGDFNSEQETISWIAEGGAGGSTTTTTEEEAAAAIEEKIDDSELEDCLEKVLDSLKGHRHGVGNIIVELAENNYSNFNWAVKSSTTTTAMATATTSINYNTLTNTATTTFHAQSFPKGTDLSWARTILHEAVHAYVVSISKTSTLTFEERKELLGPNWIIAYINDNHDYIAQTYVSSIADLLQEYGQFKGYTMNRQFYEDLAWGGLQGTNTFNSLSTTDKNRILDLIAIELTGKDRYGNNKTQKGTNAGC